MPSYHTYNDQELLTLFKTDDEQALVEIYNRYWEKMLAVAVNRLGNLEEAEECVQDVLYKLWRLRDRFTLQKDGLSAYLARAIRNHTFNILEQRHRRRLQLSEYATEEVVETLSPERQLIFQELQNQIDSAIQSLPPQCRLVFMMNKNEGLSTKEIAETLQLSENTVKSHLKKAKKDLGNNTDLLITLVFAYIYLNRL